MAQYFSLNDKVEAALAVLVAAAAPAGTQVLTGKSPQDVSLPVAICSAEAEGDEDPKGSGNYFVRGMVTVRSSAVINETAAGSDPDPKGTDQGLVSSIFAAVMMADLAEQLTAAGTDLTVFPASVQFGAPESGYGEKGHWIDTLPFRCYACGAALA